MVLLSMNFFKIAVCGREELNLHSLAATSPSSLRVYHFTTSACAQLGWATPPKAGKGEILDYLVAGATLTAFLVLSFLL